jgi:alkanesulfonate monooxygenase SsuD/methylene tetrahydromethanopterin reductase-like flavin-dependent oxidoreductase (luciferase family)
LREAITVIRGLWTGEWVTFKGEYYTLDEARLYDKPANPIPIYVAASGPKTARMAGELGDGLISVGGAYSEALDRVQVAFTEGAAAAGKDPAGLPRLCELYVVAGDEEDALPGAELWRHHGGLHGILDIPDPRTILRLAREQVDPRQVVRRWVVGRDPEVHIAALRQLGERGFTHVTLHAPQPDQRRFIEFYRREVLPLLRRG